MTEDEGQANLRYLLNEWDPIGVAGLVPDEYDCLLAPLWSRLSGGQGRAAISEYLWFELEDHFHLDPVGCGVDAIADRLVAWAAAVRRTTGETAGTTALERHLGSDGAGPCLGDQRPD